MHPGLMHAATAPMAVGNADGWTGEDSGSALAVFLVVLALWWLVTHIPIQGRRTYHLLALGRPVHPVAAIAVLVTGGLASGVVLGVARGVVIGGPVGVALAATGLVACSMLTAGWLRISRRLMTSGMFLAAVVWGGTAGAAAVDGSPLSAWFSACWAALFGLSWVIESTARHVIGGKRGER